MKQILLYISLVTGKMSTSRDLLKYQLSYKQRFSIPHSTVKIEVSRLSAGLIQAVQPSRELQYMPF